MQFRVDTQTVDDELRRAIKWAMNGHRTPASREQCMEFAQERLDQAYAEVLGPYRQYMAVLEKAQNSGK
jgi:hypothetical protein